MTDLVPRRPSGFLAALQGNSTAKEVATIQERAFVERAHVAARRDLALLRMADVSALTRVGIDEAADVTDRMVAAVERNPYAAKAVARIAETGVRGLDRELSRFIDGD